ncbi:unnamed protein product [Caenorhabditis auriculariae]|uniref:non-specific protein-tyrosine kinase n=1 Tax=Caenorhabditis auriculariae TaxID=2777116 RepID=A0A8S1HFB6_9PELO|nr:unnamed protein product [Caenorhabditis auriculariae]
MMMMIRYYSDRLKARFRAGSESRNAPISPPPMETHELLVPQPLTVVDPPEKPHDFLKKWPGFHGYIHDLDARKLIHEIGDYIIRLEEDGDTTYIILTVGEEMKEDPFWETEPKEEVEEAASEDGWMPMKVKTYVIVKNEVGFSIDGLNCFESVDSLLSYYVFHPDKSSLNVQLLYNVPRKIFEFKPENIQKMTSLSSGRFFDVDLCKIDRPGIFEQIAAVKSVKLGLPNASEQSQKLIEEGRLLLDLEHPNIIQILGWCLDEHPFKLVIQFVPGGPLDMYLLTHFPVTSVKRLMRFAVEIAQGLEYLHCNRVIHRDIAARNILLSSDGTPKISNFHLSLKSRFWRMKVAEKIPLRYVPPEVFALNIFSQKSDVYAFGVLLFEIFTGGSPPYEGLLSDDVKACIMSNTLNQFPEGTPPKLAKIRRGEHLGIFIFDERPMMDENGEYGPVTDAETDKVLKNYQPDLEKASQQRSLLELDKDVLEELCPTQDETISKATQEND